MAVPPTKNEHNNGTSINGVPEQREISKDTNRTSSWKPHVETQRNTISIDNMEELELALQSGNLDEVANKFSRAAFHDAESMPAVILMNHGRFEDLTYADVEDLFNCLDEDHSGLLEFEEISLLLQEVLDPPCTMEQIEIIYELTDRSEAGVTPQELFAGLTSGPVKEHLKRLQRENRLKHQFEQALGMNCQVPRSMMVNAIRKSVDKDDAFKTLPISLVNICIFIFLVIGHLKVWERQQVERGMQNWITGYGGKLDGPYIKEHVSDVGTTYDWLRASGLPSILGVCQRQNDTGASSYFSCHVGTRNLLLGDIELRQTRQDRSQSSIWLLHSEQAVQHLNVHPGDYLGAANASINYVRLNNWADADTDELHIRFDTYGPASTMFAACSVIVSFDDYGVAHATVAITSVPVRAYPAKMTTKVSYIVMDMLYCLCWFIPLIKEMKDMIHLMRISGWVDGFVGYWGLWNAVDWVSITMGIVVLAVWLMMCQAMQAEEIQSLLIESGSDWLLTPRAMDLGVGDLEILQERFATITGLFFTMHLVMGFTAFSIMLKFFKAFQANPRLQLVTNTLVRAGSDIFHFSVVFLAVFLGFAVTGHILLGNDLLQFRSFSCSIDTCFIVLMGEFGWYEGVSNSDDALASGLPFAVLLIWFWSYMVFVLLIMINMLLAIVLEHYTELVHEVSNDAEAISLWAQTAYYIKQARKTRDHIPLPHILCELEDDDTPCHTEDVVTDESLQAAFPKMDAHQVSHLYEWLREEAQRGMVDGDDEMIARLKSMGQYVEHLAADLHVVKLNVAVCTSRLRGELNSEQPEPPSPKAPSPPGSPQSAANRLARQGSARNRGLVRRKSGGPMSPGRGGDVSDQVEGLTRKVGEAIQQMTWQIGGATDKLLSQGAALQSAVNEVLGPPMPQANGHATRSLPAIPSNGR